MCNYYCDQNAGKCSITPEEWKEEMCDYVTEKE